MIIICVIFVIALLIGAKTIFTISIKINKIYVVHVSLILSNRQCPSSMILNIMNSVLAMIIVFIKISQPLISILIRRGNSHIMKNKANNIGKQACGQCEKDLNDHEALEITYKCKGEIITIHRSNPWPPAKEKSHD